MHSGHRERAVVAIIAYKFVKGGLWLIFALVLVVAMRMGLGDRMLGFAEHLRRHSGAWSLELGKVVVRASSPKGLWIVTFALVADGVTSLVEGWALFHGRWWGPWLVVAATGSLLPFEVVAMARHPHVGRAIIFAINSAVVAYLARKALRERATPHAPRDRGSGESPPGVSPPA